GYSSLARLHELPLQTLKIDQSFVMRMAHDGNDAVVRSVTELAHALGMDVIAEGVEDEATAQRLRDLGAECLQGYHLSRPLPVSAFVGGQVMAGNFRDQDGGCYVWLNLAHAPLLTAQEICKLALHEMGHLTGLQHSQDPKDVMYSPFESRPIPPPCVKPLPSS